MGSPWGDPSGNRTTRVEPTRQAACWSAPQLCWPMTSFQTSTPFVAKVRRLKLRTGTLITFWKSGDVPVTPEAWPPTSAVPDRNSTTVDGCRLTWANPDRTAWAAVALNGWNVFGERMKSARVWLSMASENDAFADAPKMEMRLTSARPIMSAAA